MPVVLLAALLWHATGAIEIPPGGVRRFDLPPIPVAARLVVRARLAYWRPAGSAYALRAVLNGTPLGPMRDRRTPRRLGTLPAATGLAPFGLGLWRLPFTPLAAAGVTLALDVSDLLHEAGPSTLDLGNGGDATTALVVDQIRLEPTPPSRPRAALPAPPDWWTPRLWLPGPPRFDARGDVHQIHVAWDGVGVDVRTTVTGDATLLERSLVLHETHVEVRDTVRNPGTAVAGLRIRHAVETGAEWIHLGGRPDADVTDLYDPWNPTVFTPVGARGLGLVAEDDVLRQQLHVDFDPATSTMGLGTDMLCLGAGAEQTLVWSIYPGTTDSYWDFANTVRADWGVNKSIPGSYVWFTPDDVLGAPLDGLRAALAHQGVGVASLFGGWVDRRRGERPQHIGFGSEVLSDAFADYRARIQAAVARLKAARPGIRCLLYFDAQRDSAPDAPTRYADSLLRTPGGRPHSTDFGGQYSPSWDMVPTLDDGYGRALLAVAALPSTLGADGLYWDEMTAVDYEAPRTTARPWDGRSCDLDVQGRVVRPVGLVNLLSEAAKLAYADDRLVLANSPPTTRSFQARPDVHMVETQHGPGWGAFTHLSDPLGYLGAARGWDAVLARLREGLLVAGTRLDYAYDLPARMFPFTPEYLQPGTLRGRERIVTVESGTHGWTDGGAVRLWRYDAAGHEHAADWRVKHRHGATLVHVRLGPNEAAVIERVSPP